MPAPARRLLVTAARLLDGRGGPPLTPAAVLVEGDRIAAVGAAATAAAATGVDVLDLPGCTLLPGFVDCHVHLTRQAVADPDDDRDEPAVRVLRTADHARRTLLAGVTTVRDCGGTDHLEMGVRRAAAAGLTAAPRLVLCGRIISISTPGAAMWPGMYHQADGAAAVMRAVREEVREGADAVKVMATGSVMAPPGERPGQAQYTAEELRAAVDTAHGLDRRVAAHAHGTVGMRRAVEAGVDTVEHGTMLHLDPALLEEMARRGTALVPTLRATTLLAAPPGPGIPDAIIEKAREVAAHHRRSVAAALAAGVPIAMGTDAATSFNRHGENLEELPLMVEAGLTPMQAIVAATGGAAAALGLDDRGVLEAGRLADVVAVEGDVLADITRVARPPRLVLLGGAAVVGG